MYGYYKKISTKSFYFILIGFSVFIAVFIAVLSINNKICEQHFHKKN